MSSTTPAVHAPASKPAIRIVLEPLAHESDVQRVVALEAASYPADEAASEHSIRYRLQHAGAFFVAAFTDPTDAAGDTTDASTRPRELVGFVNGTLTSSRELEEASMHEHDPTGTTLCIHSVAVDAARRRQGLAAVMLKQYVRGVVEQQSQVQRIVLVAKAHLVAFYVRCGFAVTRLSPVVHGKDPWFELALDCVAARRLPVVQVDAFTSEMFDGNPAAVVVMPSTQFHKPGATQWMQRVAMENNLSETAYVARRAGSSSPPGSSSAAEIAEFDLRWFTPAVEIALCGHATLSSALVLYEDGLVPPTATIHFHTLSGVLVCRREASSATTGEPQHLIAMDFPLLAVGPASESVTPKASLAAALGIAVESIVAVKRVENTAALVHIDTAAFASVKPNFQLIAEIDARAVIVTSEHPDKSAGVDYQNRFFGPRGGVDEDPVTGSAHCALATYWSGVLNKHKLFAQQTCPQRGGFLTLELLADRPGRLSMKGEGVISMRGVLLTAP